MPLSRASTRGRYSRIEGVTVSDLDAYMSPDVPIITETNLLAMDFSNVRFVHCRRETNLVADCLAKHCFSLGLSEFWDSSNPLDFILPHIVNGMAYTPFV